MRGAPVTFKPDRYETFRRGGMHLCHARTRWPPRAIHESTAIHNAKFDRSDAASHGPVRS